MSALTDEIREALRPLIREELERALGIPVGSLRNHPGSRLILGPRTTNAPRARQAPPRT